MSKNNVGQWLLSQNRFTDSGTKSKAKVISIVSGKGGVGKTSVSLKLARILAGRGHRTLLIDSDTNLSNTRVKLGLPLDSGFDKFLKGETSFDSCLYKDRHFHLLAGCNGHANLIEEKMSLENFYLSLLAEQENNYDYILVDCPAGIAKTNLVINANADYRFVVVTPDRSSITDSYSLIKVLNSHYGVENFHMIINKVSNEKQFKRISNTLSGTVDNFLTCRLRILGKIQQENLAVDEFDQLLLGRENTALHHQFVKVVDRFAEELVGRGSSDFRMNVSLSTSSLTANGQEVRQPLI